MEFTFKKLSDQWHQLVEKAKHTEYISYDDLFEVFKATYTVFSSLSEMELVPRKACQILMLMDEFTYYASMMDENYFGDICPGLYYLNYALKREFFRGDYQSEFFMGEMPTDINAFVLNIEQSSLDEFICFLQSRKH